MKLYVVHWIWSLSLGGDAKNLCMLSCEQQKWARVSVLTELQDPGVRADELRKKNIAVVSGMDSADSISRFVNENPGPTIAVIHRNGRTNVKETAIIQAFNRLNIPCFEYNTFSRLDPTTDQYFLGHAHLSRSALLDYARRKKVSVFDLLNHRAIGYALELPPLIDQDEAKRARENLGIRADEFVVLKVQRPDLRKWSPLPALAVSRLQNDLHPLRLLMQSAPSARKQWLKERLNGAVTLMEVTSDPLALRQTFAASDCLTNYSNIGETFGLGLAEAMAYGLPVIVNSTPGLDNAQIELCRHEKTGLVANSLSALSSAIRRLMEDRNLAQSLGVHAREFIAGTFKADIVELRFRRFMIACLQGKDDSLSSLIESPPPAEDNYQLNQAWLAQSKQAQSIAQTSGESLLQSLVDDAYVNYLRGLDAFDYAAEIGPHALMAAVKRRAKHGFILRG